MAGLHVEDNRRGVVIFWVIIVGSKIISIFKVDQNKVNDDCEILDDFEWYM